METGSNFNDGDYSYNELKNAMDKDFLSEKDLCDYIENNIALFARDCLSLEYKSHKRECQLVQYNRSLKGNRRIDFLITTSCGKRIGLECKNPYYISELSNAIGQCLSYMALFETYEQPIDKIIIVSTKIDSILPLVINKYNLPIGFIAFDKTKFITLKSNGST